MSVVRKSYYDVKRMQAAMAVAVVALLAATVWVLMADARRTWKDHQREYRTLRGLSPKSPAIEQIWLADLPLGDKFRGAARRDRCTTCHQGIDRAGAVGLPQPYAAHPRLDLFVGGHSPHPMGDFGCTVCHDGQGSATDFRWASHTPNGPAQGRQWSDRLGWSANPHWDLPMTPRRFEESRCVACHPEVVDLETSRRIVDPPARELLAGYHLVRQYGCFGCHEIPPFAGPVIDLERVAWKAGPSLRKVAGKFDREYLVSRLRNPAEFLPSTRMPRLFGFDEHLSGRVRQDTRKSDENEIRAVVDYLLASAERIEPPRDVGAASPEHGKRLFEMSGCIGCHRRRDFPDATATQGPDLSSVGAKYCKDSGTTWLVGWIRDPARYSPQTLMPRLLQGDSAIRSAADLAAYLIGDRAISTSKSASGPRELPGVMSARQTIARRGCAGCHDIPGLEDARPIGPSLRGWGRKPEPLLAFERINEFVAKAGNPGLAAVASAEPSGDDGFFADSLLSHRREGFLWQKLRLPRSFDYAVSETKPVGEQLRMGRFTLNDAQRQSIATFILAPTDEPPAKYVFRPNRQRQAIIDGRKVLDKYGCAGCHTLELERWVVAGVELSGMPRLDPTGALQQEEDEDGAPSYFFTLWAPAVIGGQRRGVGGADVVVRKSERTLVRPPHGGEAARLLYPVALAEARRSGASGAEVEAWGWLPPALVHEGAKVQPEWLFRFLLGPQALRPAVAMRMPRFNLSTDEASKLTYYFAAIADVDYPYTVGSVAPSASPTAGRLDAAMRLVSDRTEYCGRCHSIGGQTPPGESQLLHAPALDRVGRRLRPEYLRRWLADPKSVLPYTAMPALFPTSGKPGGQNLLPGSSQQQLDAVVELLLQFDEHAR